MSRHAFRLTGRVQGVGFRYFVARLGRSLGLHGGVRNERDGSLVAAVETTEDEPLAEFRAGLGRGPAAARVERVDAVPADDGPWDVTY